MTLIDYQKFLEEAIASLQPADDPGQLAYLALSSKCEHAIRDRMALLIRKHRQGEFQVARELTLADERRERSPELATIDATKVKKGGIDLAVLEGQGKKVLSTLELKQVYGFDFIGKKSTFDSRELEKLRRDIVTQRQMMDLFELDASCCPVLLLVFDALPDPRPPDWPRTSRVLKYPDGHKLRFQRAGRAWAGEASAFLSSSGSFWNQETGQGASAQIATNSSCGSAEGFSVTLDAWLLWPRGGVNGRTEAGRAGD